MHQQRLLALCCALSLAVAGCTGLQHLPQASIMAEAPMGRTSVVLQPKLTPSQGLQAVITPYTTASIHRLDVIPYVETNPGVFKPLSATTGLPIDTSDPTEMLRSTQSAPTLDVTRSITLGNLQHDATYRFYARAYDINGTLISTNDANSYVQLTVGKQDRHVAAALPIKLIDRPFAGSTSVNLAATGAIHDVERVQIRIFTIVDGVEVELAGGASSTTAGLHPDTLALTNLHPSTTYRVKGTAFDYSDVELATASADVVVTNVDAPGPVTLTMPIPPYVVATLAGSAGQEGFTDGIGSQARFRWPLGLAADGAGHLYVLSGHALRKIVTTTGEVTTLAGSTSGSWGHADGVGTAAKFDNPTYVTLDGGFAYITDRNNQVIRKVDLGTGQVSTIAGTLDVAGSTDGIGTAARFDGPGGLATDGAGNLYLADSRNHTIRKIVLATGEVTTLAGTAGSSGSADGNGAAARFNFPLGLALDGSGNLYVADSNNGTIRKIVLATREVTTIVGTPNVWGSTDGIGSAARVSYVEGIACDGASYLYLADAGNNTIRKVNLATGRVTTIAGTTAQSGSTDGQEADARFSAPIGIALDASGSIFVGDFDSDIIRKITR